MSKEHKIHTLSDMLRLSPEQFTRMLPDLVTWYAFARTLDGLDGVKFVHQGMTWVDDGKHEITGARLSDGAGNVHEVPL